MTMDLSRAHTVAGRNRQADVIEMRADKQAVETRYMQDCNDLEALKREQERIRLLVVKQEAQVTESRARLQTRIRALAELELEESE